MIYIQYLIKRNLLLSSYGSRFCIGTSVKKITRTFITSNVPISENNKYSENFVIRIFKIIEFIVSRHLRLSPG